MQDSPGQYQVAAAGLSGKVVDDLFPSLAKRAAVANIAKRTDIDLATKKKLIEIELTTLR